MISEDSRPNRRQSLKSVSGMMRDFISFRNGSPWLPSGMFARNGNGDPEENCPLEKFPIDNNPEA